MLKVRPEQDKVDNADQRPAAGPSCSDIIVETKLADDFPVTEPELRAIARLLGSELDVILGLLR